MEEQDEVLSGLAHRLGLTLSFDANRQCFLMLDEILMVSIRAQAWGWLFYGMVKDGVDWQEKPFWQDVLALNLSLAEEHAGAISYEPTAGAVVYADGMAAAELSADSVYAFLEKFVDRLESIRAHPNFA